LLFDSVLSNGSFRRNLAVGAGIGEARNPPGSCHVQKSGIMHNREVLKSRPFLRAEYACKLR
jgi:hypothetical protein